MYIVSSENLKRKIFAMTARGVVDVVPNRPLNVPMSNLAPHRVHI